MILNKVARCYGKQIGFFGNRTIQQSSSSTYILGSKKFYSTQQQQQQQQQGQNKDQNKDQKNGSQQEKNKDEKEKKSNNKHEEDEDDEDVKKRRFNVPPLITSVSSMFFLGTIIASAATYAIYNYKKDITEEERYRLSAIESKIYHSAAEPFREFFDNVFENLRSRYELFDSLFGPAKLHKVLPPPLPGGKKYTLVIDIDALTEITKKSKYPTVYKRTGLDFFLEHLKKDYEIYLFFNANIPQGKIEQLYFKIDNNGQYFTGQLFSDNGLKERNQFTKKVEMLDRDPSKVIFIDAAPPYNHPNVINVGKFHSNSKDTLLIELLPVLESFSKKKIDDVRPEIQKFQDIEHNSLKNMLRDYMKENNINSHIKK